MIISTLRLVIPILLVAALGIWLFTPDKADDTGQPLPWMTELDAEQRLKVFGFTLGATPIDEVRTAFGTPGEAILVVDPDAPTPYRAEVLFDQVTLNRLRGHFQFRLDVDQAALAALHEAHQGSGRPSRGPARLTLGPTDSAALGQWPIEQIIYHPMARLHARLIESRFGPPEQLFVDTNGVQHWLYPHRGMAIGHDPRGMVRIQYVNPADFDRLHDPLRDNHAAPAR
ncbi:hypothetical protein ABC977_15555 [Thioalkalicoccus limnaeus]|uniref:Uncharacterized protein n=1 Tax=Thioalkalicoccus limnaeus TaxID=120681 RepID=A0ABV4BH17_9GAMM